MTSEVDGVEARDGKAEKKLERKAENFSAGALLCGVCGFGGYAGEKKWQGILLLLIRRLCNRYE